MKVLRGVDDVFFIAMAVSALARNLSRSSRGEIAWGPEDTRQLVAQCDEIDSRMQAICGARAARHKRARRNKGQAA